MPRAYYRLPADPRPRGGKTQPPKGITKQATGRRLPAAPTSKADQPRRMQRREARRRGPELRGQSLKNGAVSCQHTQGAVP
ncbi:hypothetical protein NDU88_004468 [Pleurodeles waltl]|uniref:Uncharacterized protein n=1 Tax=Pleurodeles waltl TaxID=8319 RepID=A0AAV7VH75_PLEWA|nr:hypothetical protein NDU88_004468 [Pleurodeles waltl]